MAAEHPDRTKRIPYPDFLLQRPGDDLWEEDEISSTHSLTSALTMASDYSACQGLLAI